MTNLILNPSVRIASSRSAGDQASAVAVDAAVHLQRQQGWLALLKVLVGEERAREVLWHAAIQGAEDRQS